MSCVNIYYFIMENLSVFTKVSQTARKSIDIDFALYYNLHIGARLTFTKLNDIR